MRMILVLSFGGSLRGWHDRGLLSREIEIYLQYLAQGIVDRLYIFSYAHDDDIALVGAPVSILQRIELVRPLRPIRTKLSQLFYSLNLSRAHAIRNKGVNVAKTNQSQRFVGCSLAPPIRCAGLCAMRLSSVKAALQERQLFFTPVVLSAGIDLVLHR
jgi:hypothetical protein